MPLIHGVGDEVLCTIIVASAPVAILVPAALRSFPNILRTLSSACRGLCNGLFWWARRRRRSHRRNEVRRRQEQCSRSVDAVGISRRNRHVGTSADNEQSRDETEDEAPDVRGTSSRVGEDGQPSSSRSGSSSIGSRRLEWVDDERGGGAAGLGQQSLRAMGFGISSSSRRNDDDDDDDGPPEDELCCICRDSFELPCQANCGHWFCASCILSVWRHASALPPVPCPICRRTITLLMPSMPSRLDATAAATVPPDNSISGSAPASSSAAADGHSGRLLQETLVSGVEPTIAGDRQAERERVLREVAKYNRLFGGAPVSLWQRILDMPLLLTRLARDFLDPVRALRLIHNIRITFCLVLVVLYVVSPFDFISEYIMGLLGFADDILLIVCVGFYVSVIYRAILVDRFNA